MPKKILILMSDTGGGHRASADAIAEAIAHLYGDEVRVRIVDAWRNYVPWPVNRIPDAYPWLVSDGLWLWNALWCTDDKAWSPRVVSRIFTPLVRHSAIKLFRSEAPDLVVTVHPIINHIPLRVLRNVLKSDTPFVTVVTDMVTAHPTWFCPQADYCMVPTEPARLRALRYGMRPDRVEVVGQPVGLRFATGLGGKLRLRGKLGIDLDRPAVLIVGGGEGIGPVYETARAIASSVPTAQLIIVAGRNTALQQQLKTTTWEIPTRVYGFATNMPELMGASDVLITKAGPGTLSEAFIAGLPVIISDFIPGQEEGNVHYVLEHQAGVYAPDPAKIVFLIRKWLQPDDDTLGQMAANAAALARPEAAMIIAQRLHGLLLENKASLPFSARVATDLASSSITSCTATCHKKHDERDESWQPRYPARM
jgi:1,2-diacylglycerol 3-beta-galactosyltransferase